MKDVAEVAVKKKIMTIIIGSLVSIAPFLFGFFVVIVAVFLVLGLFDTKANAKEPNKNGSYAYEINGKKVENIKVRLLNCEGNTPVANEELIDFETYILGVVYAENGNAPYEALKAQAVAARSYSLTRPSAMGGAVGITLVEENGQWILSLRSCTNDQVFCNPDKGCWSKVTGGQTDPSNPSNDAQCTVYSGTNSNFWSKPPLAADSLVRKAVKETEGEVLINSENNIVKASYTNTTQTKWNNLAKEGYDYFEILVDSYKEGVTIKKPEYVSGYIEGNGVATGNYEHPCPEMTRLSSPFGPRTINGKPDYHEAVDLAAPFGSKVYAFDGGTVVSAGGGCVVGDTQCNWGMGNFIRIDHDNGMITRYIHLSKLHVKVNQKVDAGQLIGEVGNTGYSFGNHLDFQIVVDGKKVNPELYYDFR